MNFIDDDIINLLNQISTEIRTIENIIELFTDKSIFFFYLHNRIGSYLTKIEKDNLNTLLSINLIKKGDICILKDTDDSKWALCIDIIDRRFRKYFKLLYKDKDKNIKIDEIVGGRVTPYLDKLLPENSQDMRFDGSYIYETYYWDNNIKYF